MRLKNLLDRPFSTLVGIEPVEIPEEGEIEVSDKTGQYLLKNCAECVAEVQPGDKSKDEAKPKDDAKGKSADDTSGKSK